MGGVVIKIVKICDLGWELDDRDLRKRKLCGEMIVVKFLVMLIFKVIV